MTACNISAAAIHRLRGEAARRELNITTAVADMRSLPVNAHEAFDVVIAFDNSLPHLLSPEELLNAFRGFLGALRPGGIFLGSVRDYERVARDVTSTHPYGERWRNGVQYRLRQEWSGIGLSITRQP